MWNWTTATEPYNIGQWNVIVEGLLASLRAHFEIPFVFVGRVFYDVNHPEPRVIFPVTHEPETSLLPGIVGRCGIQTWTEDDGSRKIAASVDLYFFHNETRLVNADGVLLQYELAKNNQGESVWKSNGWQFDYGATEGCSWDDLKR